MALRADDARSRADRWVTNRGGRNWRVTGLLVSDGLGSANKVPMEYSRPTEHSYGYCPTPCSQCKTIYSQKCSQQAAGAARCLTASRSACLVYSCATRVINRAHMSFNTPAVRCTHYTAVTLIALSACQLLGLRASSGLAACSRGGRVAARLHGSPAPVTLAVTVD